jgi:hypothetical protein
LKKRFIKRTLRNGIINILKGCGCFEIVFDECESCKMPVVGGR